MTTVNQAFRFELDPSDRTRSALASHCGASRFAFNWGLALIEDHLAATSAFRVLALRQGATGEQAAAYARAMLGPVPWSLPALRRRWNAAKDVVAPWWSENSKEAYSSGLDALARALANYFDAKSGRRKATMGFPKRKKHHARRSCRFSTGAIKVTDHHHVQLPRLGVIRTKEPTGALLGRLATGSARVLSATISEEAGRWFVSFTCGVERHDRPASHPETVVGVDLGVHHLAALSSGEIIDNPKAVNRYQRRIARLGRELSRRTKGSKGRVRTKAALARCHRKVVNIRSDAIHKLTTDLAGTHGTLVIEDLNVAGMTRAPRPKTDEDARFIPNGRAAKAGLNRSVLDASPGEARRQLTYKLQWHGGRLIVADRFFASSKLCSSCGAVKAKLRLDERIYRCDSCGLEIDRDLNAAINLAAYGRRVMQDVAVSGTETLNARGGGHPRLSSKPPVKREDGSGQPDRTVTVTGQPVAPEFCSEVA